MMRRIDLLPAVYEERRRERRNLFLVVVGGVVAFLLLVGWFLLLGMRVNDAESDLAEHQAQNLVLQQQITELQQFADLETEVLNKRTSLQTVMAGDLNWPVLLTEVAMVIPDDVWLVSMTSSAGSTEGATAVPTETNAIDIDQRPQFGRILFNGKALSMRAVANWLIRLETVDEFLAVYLGSSAESQDADAPVPVFDFSTTLELGEDAVSKRFQDTELDGDE